MDGDKNQRQKPNQNPKQNQRNRNMTSDSRENNDGGSPDSAKYLEPPPELDFDDVGGMKDLKTEIEKRVIRPLKKPHVYEEHGADAVNGILLHGPPGTGKTYLSKALAGELGFNFIEVHSS
ncbi:MAG: ATP-binding protein, partial [Halobacteria archaeon]|nr:ATP-binding protein [Halobacteria archaeon]